MRKVWIEQVEQEIRSALGLWNDKDSSQKELQLALAFWNQYHSPGSRNRVRAAIAYYRKCGTSKETRPYLSYQRAWTDKRSTIPDRMVNGAAIPLPAPAKAIAQLDPTCGD